MKTQTEAKRIYESQWIRSSNIARLRQVRRQEYVMFFGWGMLRKDRQKLITLTLITLMLTVLFML